MHLYLVRHGEAQREDVDPERHLTARGVEEVTNIAKDAVDLVGVRQLQIFHSGKARAAQTAEIWAGLVGIETTEADGLAPNDDPAIWAGRLEGQSDDVMLVGHLPHLERLVGLLVTGDADTGVAGFPAGGFVALERTDGGWAVAATGP